MLIAKVYLIVSLLLSCSILLLSRKAIKHMSTKEVVILFVLSPLLAAREIYYIIKERITNADDI